MKVLLPLFGHRNWIVVADAAYPAQSSTGIEIVFSGTSQIVVVRRVLSAVRTRKHVRAKILVDRELQLVAERDAPGVSDYRIQLAGLLKAANPTTLPHEQIIAKIDRAAQAFRVLIIKTYMKIPYTSVFFELDCGYWAPEAEKRLRRAMAVARSK